MSDLIDRQAAIDAMEGLPKYFDTTDTLCLDYADVLAVLSEHLPSAQPEIIRCKDCKYWGEKWLCGKWDYYISNEDFYCGCAERRTDD